MTGEGGVQGGVQSVFEVRGVFEAEGVLFD